MRTLVKDLLMLAILTLSGGVCYGSPLSDMTRSIEALGAYDVEFSVLFRGEGDEVITQGRYSVDGSRYHLFVGDQEVYGDSQLRVATNHTLREVVIEYFSTEDATPMVMVNPAIAFTSLERLFRVDTEEDHSEDDGVITLRLTPHVNDDVLLSSLLDIDAETHLPRLIHYEAEGESVSIQLRSITRTERSLPHPAESPYPQEYEIFDLR